MARIRSIKPTFFRSRSVKALSSDAKLVWIGLWTAADDEGRLVDEIGILAGDFWALSLTALKLDRILDELARRGRIRRYSIDGRAYIEVVGWSEHQRINRPSKSQIPPAPLTHDSVSPHVGLTPGREGKGIGREGETSDDVEPSPFCSKHQPNGSGGAPCGPCGDARQAHALWARAHPDAHKPTTPTPPRDLTPAPHNHQWLESGYCLHCGASSRDAEAA